MLLRSSMLAALGKDDDGTGKCECAVTAGWGGRGRGSGVRGEGSDSMVRQFGTSVGTDLMQATGSGVHFQVSRLGMSLDEGRQSQRPYRYGMVLLCAGALINWLGLAEEYAEPVRYVGVACIVAGALLICAAMCCWLQSPARSPPGRDHNTPDTHQIDDPIHVISMPDEETMQQKPPDYDTVAGAPPTYDDAIKLNPARLLTAAPAATTSSRRPASPPPSPAVIPGQPDDASPSAATAATALPPAPVHIPKTPPPPYHPVRTIR